MKKPDRRILCVLSWIFLTVPSVYYVPVLGKYGVYLFLCFFFNCNYLLRVWKIIYLEGLLFCRCMRDL